MVAADLRAATMLQMDTLETAARRSAAARAGILLNPGSNILNNPPLPRWLRKMPATLVAVRACDSPAMHAVR